MMTSTYAGVAEVTKPMPAWHRIWREALPPWQRYIDQPLPVRHTRIANRIINRLVFRRASWLGLAAMMACLGSHPAQAQCCGCIDAANLAGRVTTQSVNAYTSAAIAVQAGIIVTALQGHAAQTSANIRGTITGQGLIAEALDNHETQRQLQGDRVEAAKAYQFSTPLCQGATGSGVAIAMTTAAVPDAVRRSQANARRTAGSGGALAVAAAFDERRPLFCDAQRDPACNGVTGTRPNADRMPGSILAASRLGTDADRTLATWLVQSRLLCAQLTSDGHLARNFEESGLRFHPVVDALPGLSQLDGGPPSVFAPSSVWLAFRDQYRWDPTKLQWASGADAVLAWREAYPPVLRWWIHDIDYDNDSYSAIVLDDDGHIKMSRYLPLFSEAGAKEEARIWSMDIGMLVQLFRLGVEIARFG